MTRFIALSHPQAYHKGTLASKKKKQKKLKRVMAAGESGVVPHDPALLGDLVWADPAALARLVHSQAPSQEGGGRAAGELRSAAAAA